MPAHTPAVTAAVHHPTPSAPPAIYAYVILKNDCPDPSKDVMEDLRHLVRKKIGPIAVPEKFLVLVCMPAWTVH